MQWRYLLIAGAIILAVGAWWLTSRVPETPTGVVQIGATEPTSVTIPDAPPPLPAPTPSPSDQVPRLPPEASAAVVDGWAGRWDGLDGRFMEIARDPAAPGHYRVTMRYGREEKQASFAAVATGDSIIVDRPERKVMFNRGSGKDAGDRRLFERRDCLVEEAGEGYCRN